MSFEIKCFRFQTRNDAHSIGHRSNIILEGKLTDSKVRKVNTLTIDDPKLQDTVVGEMKYNNILKFSSSELLDKFVKTWFNDEFSIVTLPEDRNFSNFCLIPNR